MEYEDMLRVASIAREDGKEAAENEVSRMVSDELGLPDDRPVRFREVNYLPRSSAIYLSHIIGSDRVVDLKEYILDHGTDFFYKVPNIGKARLKRILEVLGIPENFEPRCPEEFVDPLAQKAEKPKIIYSGPEKNLDFSIGRDIIVLYIQCKLGVDAIRHILGYDNNDAIEDVLEQHHLGRGEVDGELGQLLCPASKDISPLDVSIINSMISKYGTDRDTYNIDMVNKSRWIEDPVRPQYCECGQKLEYNWIICPICGKERK